MSSFDIPVDTVVDRDTFNVALSRLIEAAEANDIDIRGGYQYNADDGQHDYGIEIYRVAE